NARILVYETIELYKNHVVAEGKRLEAGELFDVELFTDRGLLGRVLGNMVKNALEADPIESVITVSCKLVNGNVIFEVNNKAYMPRNIQLQVFNRSFSSKGKGRGLGTYSMKLISERYLNGSVTFESDREKGTTFRAMYPLRYEIKK
ncbi:MAG: ATP-binding protein, partial [Chlorobiota bacterium]